jgi:hypothetical protein
MLSAVYDELSAVSQIGPRERLPKEEQIRCAVYRWFISSGAAFVRVEAGYVDPDTCGQHPECDILTTVDGLDYWMEIKGGTADVPGYLQKPNDQFAKWCDDVDKLVKHVPPHATRCFLLAGVRRRGSTNRLYSDEHAASVTAYIKSRSPSAQPELRQRAFSPFSWRDISNAELVCRLWTW